MDIALTFVDACCYSCRGLCQELTVLWESYLNWCRDCTLVPTKKKAFLESLESYYRVESNMVSGLTLRPEEEWEYWNPKDLRKVYLISDGEFTKIGSSVDPIRRLDSLQIGNPRKLTLIGSWLGDFDTEYDLHSAYQHRKVRGEWFDLTSEDVQEIERRLGRDHSGKD